MLRHLRRHTSNRSHEAPGASGSTSKNKSFNVVLGLLKSVGALTQALPQVAIQLPGLVTELRAVVRGLGQAIGQEGELTRLLRAATRLTEAQTRAVEARRRTERGRKPKGDTFQQNNAAGDQHNGPAEE